MLITLSLCMRKKRSRAIVHNLLGNICVPEKLFHQKNHSFRGRPTSTIPSSSSVSAPSSLPRLTEIDDDEASDELESVDMSAAPTELGTASMEGGTGRAIDLRGVEAESFSGEELETAVPFSETEGRLGVVSMTFSEDGDLGDISRRVSSIA